MLSVAVGMFALFALFARAFRSRWSSVHAATGVVGGRPADAVKDCETLYDEAPT